MDDDSQIDLTNNEGLSDKDVIINDDMSMGSGSYIERGSVRGSVRSSQRNGNRVQVINDMDSDVDSMEALSQGNVMDLNQDI